MEDVGDGPLSGLGDACVNVPEGVLLRGQPLFHGFVVGGAERAEVEGAGVAAHLCHVLQVGLVGAHFFG